VKIKNSDHIAKVMFIVSIAFGIFIYGMAVSEYKIFPYQQVKYVQNYVQDSLFEVKDAGLGMVTKTIPTAHLFKPRHEGSDVVHFDKDSAVPGLTLISSFFDRSIEIRLITLDGEIVNRWPINVFDIWDNFDHLHNIKNAPKTSWNAILNGIMILPDGSVVFNLFGLVKLDRCGNIVWKVPKFAHHSIEPAVDGGFWVGGKNYIGSKSKHPPIKTPYEEDTILKISSDGSIVREISVLDIFWKNNLLGVLFSNNSRFHASPQNDVIHLNDIDELTVELEDAFPQFNAGDLLVSLRQTNMIMVIDPKTELVKWYQVGPWIQQHDSDFQENGTITVFDNASDGTNDGSIFGGSKIISVDPSNRRTEILYQGQDRNSMYTMVQGDHQVFKNGNILITESNAGRVIEVDVDGRIVWEYINRYSDKKVARVPDAIRYSLDYFTVENWSCN
jgi:hypothetical protein